MQAYTPINKPNNNTLTQFQSTTLSD